MTSRLSHGRLAFWHILCCVYRMSHTRIFSAPGRKKWQHFACQFRALRCGIFFRTYLKKVPESSGSQDSGLIYQNCDIPLLKIRAGVVRSGTQSESTFFI
jgi:hypothetical protein